MSTWHTRECRARPRSPCSCAQDLLTAYAERDALREENERLRSDLNAEREALAKAEARLVNRDLDYEAECKVTSTLTAEAAALRAALVAVVKEHDEFADAAGEAATMEFEQPKGGWKCGCGTCKSANAALSSTAGADLLERLALSESDARRNKEIDGAVMRSLIETGKERDSLAARVEELTKALEAKDTKIALLASELRDTQEQVRALQADLAIVHTGTDGVWRWMGDGHDHLDTLTCPVVSRAETLREILARVEALEGALREIRHSTLDRPDDLSRTIALASIGAQATAALDAKGKK
jgi:multidrug efflux pump subunit AcrA (membrane-fusion protein)